MERFFSLAKFIVQAKRYRMTVQTLKVILMQNLWQKQQNYDFFKDIDDDENKKIVEYEEDEN